VHHIIEVEKGGTDDPINLQCLCRECHAEVHRRRELIARYLTPC
jgi:predicted HNH restriction endonuclease